MHTAYQNCKYGAVAAGQPATAQAGMHILEAGGNAYDAALAALLAACVAEAVHLSLGGGGFLLAQPSGFKRKAKLYDFFVQTPGKRATQAQIQAANFEPITVDFKGTQQTFHVGIGASAVPGCIAGIFHIHRQLGKLPIAEVFKPAIALSKQQQPITRNHEVLINSLLPLMLKNPLSKKLFTNAKGQAAQQGDTYQLPYFTDVLATLAIEGQDLFYRGEIAQSLVQDCKTKGGFISMEDLANYRVIERNPLSMPLPNNQHLLTNPPPAAGGALIGFSLQLLAQLPNLAHNSWGSAAHLTQIIKVAQTTNIARQGLVDRNLHKPDILAKLFNSTTISQYGQLLQLPLNQLPQIPLANSNNKLGNTTHISVLDAQGNAASLTFSNGAGTGYYIPQTGIGMNNMLGEADLNPTGHHSWQPNTRISSMMSPTIVLRVDGMPSLILGSSGSSRIRSAIVQTLINKLYFKQPIEEAVNSPRLHIEQPELNIEYGINAEVIANLPLPRTWKKVFFENASLFFGGVNAIHQSEPGVMAAAADPRRYGAAYVH